jgi:hypothetical protein
MTLVSAEVAAISLCLITCGRLNARRVLGSLAWGTVAGVLTLLISFIPGRGKAFAARDDQGRLNTFLHFTWLALGGVFGAVTLICLYFFVELIIFVWNFDGFGNGG